jgi:NAD(P)-dependent dehydrogenase (short-subunit alcohol dehydrogenase family)
VVTGASRGIGLAIARGLVAEGAQVLLASRSLEGVAAAACDLGAAAEALACDVGDVKDVGRLFARAAELGGADLLVCAAGIASTSAAAHTSRDELDSMLTVHLHGAISAAQEAYAQMRAKGAGSILMVTSVWGLGGQPGSLAYGSAKAALAHAVKVMAIEWARDGVRVNGLAPGFVETAMTEEIDQAARKKLRARVPMRRAAQPDEMVGPALLLLSSLGSYVTGQTLVADGGERAR